MTSRAPRVPKAMRPKFGEIMALVDPFCEEYLDEEYAELCRQLTAKLARKRPSPLEKGLAKSWAAAIVYTIGRVNFLFDKSGTPYLSATDLSKGFNVGKGTASGKSTQIMKMLNIRQFEPEWTRPSQMDHNPMAWFIMVNGLIVDARSMPIEIQREAYQRGMIPYVPADRPAEE